MGSGVEPAPETFEQIGGVVVWGCSVHGRPGIHSIWGSDRVIPRGELSIRGDILPLTRQTENIVALKISGIPDKNYEAKQLLGIPILCGWDLMSLLAYRMGADGVTSGSATLVPEHEVRLYTLVKEGRWDDARDLYYGARLIGEPPRVGTTPSDGSSSYR